MKKLLMIINPVAGRKSIQHMIPQIVRIFMDAGYLCTVMVTAEAGEATQLVQKYSVGFDLLVVAGGDGTLNEAVAGLMCCNRKIPLGYIPCGSTNEFAAAHGIPTGIPAAAKAIAAGKLRMCDIGLFGSQVFCGTAIFGAFSWMGYTTDQDMKNIFGMGAYVMDGAHDLSRIEPIHLRLHTADHTYEDDYVFGAISNAETLAGILHYPSGFVETNDGKLEALLIRKPQSLADWQQLLRCIRLRDLEHCSFVDILKSDSYKVEIPEGAIWSLDGESSGTQTCTKVSVLSGLLQLKM